MRWHIAQPFDAGIFHRRIGVEAFGDGVGNNRLPLFLQQFDQTLLLGNQRIDLGGFAVEEGGDGLLFGKRW
jgi:hypothetical protein